MTSSHLFRIPLVASALLFPTALEAQTANVTFRTVGDHGLIEGVQIQVGETGGVTDSQGELSLTLALGTYRVQAVRVGFGPVEQELTLATAGDTLVVLELEEEALHADEIVVVTSARTNRRVEDEPLRVEVVGREEVEEKLLMTPGDIVMLLNETAGLRVQPTAPSLGGASVRIQGLRGRYTQILSDGLPLYGGQGGALGALQVPPMDLGQVEVIKGAASALYGPTALGGIVNLISRRPARAREVILNQSTLDGTDAVGWLSDELSDRWGYTFLGSVHRQDYADVDTDGWADIPHFKRAVVRPRLFWDNGAGSTMMFTAGGVMEDRTGGTLPGDLTPGGAPYTQAINTRRVDGGFVGRSLLSDSRFFSGRASGSWQSHDHQFGGNQEEDSHLTAFAEATLSGQDGRHLWLIGAAFQHDGYDAQDVDGVSFDYTVPAVFVQDEFEVADWMTLAGSLRYDHHSEFGAAVSPRLSALAREGEWVVRVSAGSGFFAPSPLTEATDAVGLRRLRTPMDLLKERAKSIMLDVGRHIGPVELNVSAFASDIDDPIQTLRNDDGTLSLVNAVDPVRTKGTEILASLHQGPIHMVASHTFLKSTELVPGGTTRRNVPLTPRHSFGVVGAYEEEWGRAGLEVYYTGRQDLDDDPFRDRSKSHVVVGLLVDRKIGRFRFFLNAENILDTRQTEHDSLIRPSQTLDGRWTTDVWAPLEGRSFNGGVWISF